MRKGQQNEEVKVQGKKRRKATEDMECDSGQEADEEKSHLVQVEENIAPKKQ